MQIEGYSGSIFAIGSPLSSTAVLLSSKDCAMFKVNEIKNSREPALCPACHLKIRTRNASVGHTGDL